MGRIWRTRRICLALLSLLSCGLAAAADEPRPNVVLILGDDQGYADYGFMGHRHIRTPHLDRLAKEGLLFTRGYVPTSLCRPSLATIVTGLYPHQHAIVGNDPPGAKQDRPAGNAKMVERFQGVMSLAGMLADSGYVSFQAGKWWEGACQCGRFTEGMTHGDVAKGARHGDDGLAIGRNGMKPVFDFLDGVGDKPFLLWYAPMMPHLPHNPPPRILKKYLADGRPESLARYWAMCEWFDETIGELLEGLHQRGLAKNTLIVFLCDNGWVQDERQPAGKSPFGNPRGKRTPYEGGIRTPILLHFKGKIEQGRDETHLASSIDVVPTVLSICDVKPRVGKVGPLPGIDLLDARQAAHREAIFGAIFEHDVRDLSRPEASVTHTWVIEGTRKLILPHKGDGLELFDLAADPAEEKNLFTPHLPADRAKELARLRGRIEAWWPAAAQRE